MDKYDALEIEGSYFVFGPGIDPDERINYLESPDEVLKFGNRCFAQGAASRDAEVYKLAECGEPFFVTVNDCEPVNLNEEVMDKLPSSPKAMWVKLREHLEANPKIPNEYYNSPGGTIRYVLDKMGEIEKGLQ
jgi:hypothetical protein